MTASGKVVVAMRSAEPATCTGCEPAALFEGSQSPGTALPVSMMQPT